MSEHIGNFLLDIFPREHHWKVLLFQNWDNIIGSLSDKVRIEKLDGNLMVLGVCHPAWAQELYFMSNMIKNKINFILKEDRVKRIRFNTVELNKKTTKSKIRKKAVSKKKILSLNDEHLSILNNIKEDEFRLILSQYYTRCIKSNVE